MNFSTPPAGMASTAITQYFQSAELARLARPDAGAGHGEVDGAVRRGSAR